MSKILVTGGAGFIGYHLIKYLSASGGSRITVVDNLSRGRLDADFNELLESRKVRFLRSDLTDIRSYRLLRDNYDYVYHLSAIVGVRNVTGRPEEVLRVNTMATLNLLAWARRAQGGLKRLLFSSTSEVYAGTAKHYGVSIPTDEDVPLCLEDIRSPRATYALSKMLGESACFNYQALYGVPVTVVRYHNVYGPRMGYDHVIPELMLKAAKSRKSLEVYSPGHSRAFCYVSDAVKATVGLAGSRRALGGLFNIGNNAEEIKISSLAEKVSSIVNPGLRIKKMKDQTGSPVRRSPDTSKISRTIGFKPEVTLDEGLRLTWDWYKKRNKV